MPERFIRSIMAAFAGLVVCVWASCTPNAREGSQLGASAEPVEVASDDTDLPRVPEESLLPLEQQERVFEIIEGDDRGDLVEFTLREPQEDEPGEWLLRMGDLSVLYLEEDDEGAVLVVRMDLPREGHRVEYQPPLRLVPSRIEPNLREEESAEAHVHSLETGNLIHSGEAQHKVKYVTRSRFHTPAGEEDGYMVAIEHEIDLGLADVVLEMESGYLPGQGLVYQRLNYTISQLGVIGETTRRTAVLAEE